MRRALVVLLMVTAGCAAMPKVGTKPADETVVLLPAADGKVGALTVTHAGHERTLGTPYATTRIQEQGKLVDGGPMTSEQVQQTFAGALGAQPPRPLTFLLFFLGDSDEFTPDSKQELPKIMQAIGGRPAPEIVVVGHTDRVGTLAYNDALSLRRAERVRAQLVDIGIANEQMRVAGRGERAPLVPTADEVPEPRNRRVEITVR
jgi:outer membrane protein OmpA-like peptidoglycan-associated protein